MTDKQIIIDGIDVSGCEYFGSQENCTIRTHQKCINYPNCIYKQLKRKEQECEKLEEQLNNCNTIIDRFLTASGKSKDITLPEEFEEIFEDIEQTYLEYDELNNLFQDPEVRVALTDVQTGEREVWRKLGGKVQKYKQALDEVEEYCKDQSLKHDYTDGVILDIVNKAKENEQ